jgi:hypothetical protein
MWMVLFGLPSLNMHISNLTLTLTLALAPDPDPDSEFYAYAILFNNYIKGTGHHVW